ncbi:Abi-alpha family protein [Pseudovibrio sp. WM33]|uniref:Abi-alpha family protein n=1 Tax=Pseudovibrio sp. WM33 TaxID=1735585 RepID=UPI0007B246D0|nr:Abi-alpha family protein [Pseudovibrio sp. WM33]KZL25611.1 hypothetical protein PsWM33_01829 [Pseudovibrio sp. WM33]
MNDTNEIDEVTSIPSEIRHSLAEVVVDLLKPPAKELGSLVGDTIGILSDRVRRKREMNAKIGLSETRKKLEEAGISIETISPPKEEELHLLVNGLSLSDDETVRNLWAGIFAQSLNPDSDVKAERPFVSVLESLSPLDAKIIDFLAFVHCSNEELEQNSSKFAPVNLFSLTPEEQVKLAKREEVNSKLRSEFNSLVQEKAELYGLTDLNGTSWSSNLLRLGIIERVTSDLPEMSYFRTSSEDVNAISDYFESLREQVEALGEKTRSNSQPPESIFTHSMWQGLMSLQLQFTEFGTSFARACGLLDK